MCLLSLTLPQQQLNRNTFANRSVPRKSSRESGFFPALKEKGVRRTCHVLATPRLGSAHMHVDTRTDEPSARCHASAFSDKYRNGLHTTAYPVLNV